MNDFDEMKQKIWAPYYAALEQVVDAIAMIPVETVLEHRLTVPPSSYRDFSEIFGQRHAAAWEAIEAAYAARNRALNAAAKEKAKQEGIAKRAATLARKKAGGSLGERL